MSQPQQGLEKLSQPKGALDISNTRSSLTKLDMRELRDLAEILVAAGTFSDITSIARAQVKIIAGAELGFSPLVSIGGIHFIQGKVELSAPLKASLIKDSNKYDYKVLDHTADRCEIAFFQRRGEEWVSCGVPVVYTYAEAKAAGLLSNKVWEKYPKDMLFNACIRQGTRRYCSDLLRGFTGANAVDEAAVDAIDATAIEDTKAEGMTVDAPHYETLENGEVVNTATGEVEPDPFATAAPVSDEDAERAAIQDEAPAAAPFGQDESNLINLRTAAADIYNEAKGESRKRANDWLGKRNLGSLDAKELSDFIDASSEF